MRASYSPVSPELKKDMSQMWNTGKDCINHLHKIISRFDKVCLYACSHVVVSNVRSSNRLLPALFQCVKAKLTKNMSLRWVLQLLAKEFSAVEKIKTMGCSYMAAAGLLDEKTAEA
jgi:hypothetical protein